MSTHNRAHMNSHAHITCKGFEFFLFFSVRQTHAAILQIVALQIVAGTVQHDVIACITQTQTVTGLGFAKP